jgi:hypothetical protein
MEPRRNPERIPKEHRRNLKEPQRQLDISTAPVDGTARRSAVLQFYSVKGGLLMEKKKGCIKFFLNVPFTFVTPQISTIAILSHRRFSSSPILALRKRKKNSVLGKPKYTQTLPKGTLKKHIFMINRS